MSGKQGIPEGETWIRLYDNANLYPDVTGLTSCLTSVYHARRAVESKELGEKSIVFVVEECETIT